MGILSARRAQVTPRARLLAAAVANAVTYRMRDANAPPVLRPPTEPTLWSFARALWSSGRGWAAWPVRAAGIAVSLGGGFAIFLAPTIRWPVAAGVAVLLFLMHAVASFLLWRTEVRRTNAVFEKLEPRFRVVPVVVPSKDRVRAVVEVVNESRVRNHNLRVAVVAVDRTSGEPTDDGAAGFTGALPLEGAFVGEPAERYSATLDSKASFNVAMVTASQEGVFQCARNRRGEGPLLLVEGEAYVFHVEAAADAGLRVAKKLELLTTVGGAPSTDPNSEHPIPQRRLPSVSFRILSDEPGAADSDDGSTAHSVDAQNRLP